jgi:hypothetical protein
MKPPETALGIRSSDKKIDSEETCLTSYHLTLVYFTDKYPLSSRSAFVGFPCLKPPPIPLTGFFLFGGGFFISKQGFKINLFLETDFYGLPARALKIIGFLFIFEIL